MSDETKNIASIVILAAFVLYLAVLATVSAIRSDRRGKASDERLKAVDEAMLKRLEGEEIEEGEEWKRA